MTSIFDNGFVHQAHWKYFDLGFSTGVGDTGYDRSVALRSKIVGYLKWRLESQTFSCCGTSAFEYLNGEYHSEEEAQEFLAIVLMYSPYYGPYNLAPKFVNFNDVWMVDTSSNIHLQTNSSFFSLLCKLGAHKVYDFPNRAHGPETLELWSWNPQDCLTQLEEYIYFTKNVSGCLRFIPLYLKEQYENEQQDQASARAAAATAPSMVVPAAPVEAAQQRLVGTIGFGDVRPVHRVDIPNPVPNQDHKNWVGLNPNRNPAHQ